MDPLLGRVVAHYRVLEKIGAGGMGIVYLAEDERLHRKVALKFIAPSSATDAVAQKRLLREAQAASALDHPNIATLYEVGDFDNQLFIAMAYYSGETLKRRIDQGPMSIAETARIAEHIAEGLDAAHVAGVIHRDLKPANVFITSTGQVKILDFGLARVDTATGDTTAGVTATGTTLGTLSYMAPEQARGQHVDRRADVWALGVMLFEMLTGRLPFRGDTATAILLALATEAPPSVQSLRPDAPADFSGLVDRALAKDPDRRTLTAGDVAGTIARYRGRTTAEVSAWSRALRRPIVALPIAVTLVAAIAFAALAGRRLMNERWARYTALPEIARLADQQDFVRAVDLATQAQPLLAGSGELEPLWPRITRGVTIESEPAEAVISYTTYGTDEQWRVLGRTPLKDVRVPIGLLRFRAQKPGFETAEDTIQFGAPAFKLATASETPEGMVRAAPVRGNFSIYVFGLETPRVKFDGFWVDRYETTNRQFKAFVDAGGYKRRELWKEPFVRDGRTLTFDEAMAFFRDETGRAGPATWSLGTYAQGQDDMPVTGVSWYEASAYAAFAGKSLPTAYHWYWVASQGLTGFVIPFGNFNAKGPVAVTSTRALHRFGTYGLAGNVKEWCVNEAPGHRRYILGGGWDEPPYLFRDTDARSPFDRGANIGFRTVKYDAADTSAAPLGGMLLPPSRSYDKEKPVGEEVFQAYRRLYSYDRTDPGPKIESVDDASPDWRIEKVSVTATYGQERLIVYLLLPRSVQPPYQTIVFMPGAGAWDQRTAPSFANPQFGFLVRSGRAVAFPMFKGSYERANNEYHGGDQLKSTSLWRDYVIFFSKDISRTLDYLATRSDIQNEKIGFMGVSRGASLSPMMLTAEPRIKAATLWIPGFYLEKMAAEVDPINFAPRVTIPVLQLSGRYDYNFPSETSSEPFFNTLGTPVEHKRRVVYDTGHNLPANESIRETLDWFDRYLGLPR